MHTADGLKAASSRSPLKPAHAVKWIPGASQANFVEHRFSHALLTEQVPIVLQDKHSQGTSFLQQPQIIHGLGFNDLAVYHEKIVTAGFQATHQSFASAREVRKMMAPGSSPAACFISRAARKPSISGIRASISAQLRPSVRTAPPASRLLPEVNTLFPRPDDTDSSKDTVGRYPATGMDKRSVSGA
jgi:hypothetical protein